MTLMTVVITNTFSVFLENLLRLFPIVSKILNTDPYRLVPLFQGVDKGIRTAQLRGL